MRMSYPLSKPVRAIMLALEKEGELHAQEIVAINKEAVPGIHTTLRNLEAGGWLVSRTEQLPGERHRPRRFYQFTKQGKEAIRFHHRLVKIQHQQNEGRAI